MVASGIIIICVKNLQEKLYWKGLSVNIVKITWLVSLLRSLRENCIHSWLVKSLF